jgi:hypothetical protein
MEEAEGGRLGFFSEEAAATARPNNYWPSDIAKTIQRQKYSYQVFRPSATYVISDKVKVTSD